MAERAMIHDLSQVAGRPTTATQVVDWLITQAMKSRASDVHMGVMQQAGVAGTSHLVRFRVHGKLQAVRADFLGPIYKETIARFKVLAGISTTDISGPMDGQITVSTPEGPVVMRVNIIPTPDGEELVARLQRPQTSPGMDQLGMTREMLTRTSALIQQKSGLIVINGPAGSGKTTTIHSMLNTLASPERKIVTAEDPIELRLPLVSHTSVGKQSSFAQLARAFMRQDADVIFIGEVRDAESAESAVQLAQTGHLVVTTLHTRDALGVIPRLEAFGVHPNFIASALIGSLAQRLLPRLCPNCRVDAKPDEKLLKRMQELLPPPAGTRFFRTGPGCTQCSGGINGRAAFYELLVIDSLISEMINRRATRTELLELAQSRGMFTLAQEALMRVYTGYLDFEAARTYFSGIEV